MNKKKGIIIGIFALVVTMIIGYAYFSKNIEIKGTAKASGSFDLDYTCEYYGGDGPSGTCKVEGNTITTTSNMTKPGDNSRFTITITNNGTIPAVLKTVDSPNNYDVSKLFNDGELVAGDSGYVDRVNLLVAYYDIAASDGGEAMFSDSAVEAANITIQPGESLRGHVDYAWFDSAVLGMEQPKLPEGGVNMEYSVTLGFEQAHS